MLLDLLAPPACLVCRAPPPRGEALCRLCLAALPWIDDPCPRCALPRGRRGGCPPCPAARAAFGAAFAPVLHAGPARDLVLALKLRGALAAADAMAGQIAARAPAGLLAGHAVLVPVPGDWARRRRRGFDPAERIAAALGRRTGLPVVRSLRRLPTSTRQLGRGRAARLRGAGIVAGGERPGARSAVLVDDVHTTGATLDACAAALASAGCAPILAVTYVRTSACA